MDLRSFSFVGFFLKFFIELMKCFLVAEFIITIFFFVKC